MWEMIVQPTRTVFKTEGDPHCRISLLANCELDDEMLAALEAFIARRRKRNEAEAREAARDALVMGSP